MKGYVTTELDNRRILVILVSNINEALGIKKSLRTEIHKSHV